MINTPSVFDLVMTSSINSTINHGICVDQHGEILFVLSLLPYAAAMFFAISMIIFAFCKASRQFTVVNESGRKKMLPFSRFLFFAFLTSHGCVFGFDEVGDNHGVVHGSIRGTNVATVKPMITKLVHVRKPIPLILYYLTVFSETSQFIPLYIFSRVAGSRQHPEKNQQWSERQGYERWYS